MKITVPAEYGATQYGKLKPLQRKKYLIERLNYSFIEAHNVSNGIIWIGMTKEQLIFSWGYPDDINSTVSSSYNHEQWVYDRGNYNMQYVYLEDGIVETYQN